MTFKKIIIALLALFIAPLCSAKILTLYDQPQANAKTVGTIDSDAGLIPIYTPKNDTHWIKVADPKNGNVGWIKSSDLDMKGTNAFSFTQKVISTGNGPNSYVIQFGNPQLLTPEQSKEFYQRLQEQSKRIQQNAEKMMEEMFKNVNQNQIPVLMPVIVMPNPNATTTDKKPVTKSTTTETKTQ